jgi:hypothetical protein
MEAVTRTEADRGGDGAVEAEGGGDPDGGGDPNGGTDGDKVSDLDGGADGGGDDDGGGDPDRGGDLDGDASVEGGHRDAGPPRLTPAPMARAPLVRRFWAARLSSELVVVVKIRLWWDWDFGPRASHPNFRPSALRVPIVFGCWPVTSADTKNMYFCIGRLSQPI